MSNSHPFFLPYQTQWLHDSSKFKIMEKSRQIGLSWTAAYSLVRKHASSCQSLDSWVSSRDELQAKLFLSDCQKFAKILNIATSEYHAPLLNDSSPHSSLSLQFTNNTKIHSLTSNPDAQAGKRGSRILDEFALHPNPQQLFTIASPGITWGGQLEIISTHRGATNFFNQLIQEITLGDNPKQFSHHKVTLEDALNQGFLSKLKNKLPPSDPIQSVSEADYFDSIKNTSPSPDAFNQEYMCLPTDESSTFIPHKLLQNASYPPHTPWELPINSLAHSPHPLFLGIDLARSQDLSVFYLLESIDGTLHTRRIDTLHNTPFHLQEKLLHHYLQLPSLHAIAIDQSGIGRQFAENATRQFPSRKIIPVSFTASTKESLAFPLRAAVENQQLLIPDCPTLHADLHSVKKSYSSAGNLLLHANHSSSGHADRFWALALALHVASTPLASPHYEPISLSNTTRF